MKIKGIPGEYFAQGFLLKEGAEFLCGCYHSSEKNAENVHGIYIVWPVELLDGIAYVPSKEELEDED